MVRHPLNDEPRDTSFPSEVLPGVLRRISAELEAGLVLEAGMDERRLDGRTIRFRSSCAKTLGRQ
jgi:hypothetical protein